MAELVEGARLEIVYTGNRIKGSNPFLSAKKKSTRLGAFLFVKMKGFEGRMLQSDVSKQ